MKAQAPGNFVPSDLIELASRVNYDLPTDPKIEDFFRVFSGLNAQIEYLLGRGLMLMQNLPMSYEHWKELYWITERLTVTWKQNRVVALFWLAMIRATIESIAHHVEDFGSAEEAWFQELFEKLQSPSNKFSEWLPGVFRSMMNSVVIPVNRWREVAVGKHLEKYWMVEELAGVVFSVPKTIRNYVDEVVEKIRNTA